jgi:hypothetical protein
MLRGPLPCRQCRRHQRCVQPGLPVASASANHYEIRVRGHLGETMRAAFPELRARADGADTVLTGLLSDQAAVFGVLAAIESLGLELLEVRRAAPG